MSLLKGTCDCGDPEAWTSGHACTLHAAYDKNTHQLDAEEIRAKSRARALFGAILCFVIEVIYPQIEEFNETCSGPYEVFPYARISQAGRRGLLDDLKRDTEYYLMLFNDETHTFDQVENMLKSSVQATSSQVRLN